MARGMHCVTNATYGQNNWEDGDAAAASDANSDAVMKKWWG